MPLNLHYQLVFFDATELSSFGWTKKEVVVEEPKPKKIKKEKPVVTEKVMAEETVKRDIATAATTAVESSASGGLGFIKWLFPLLIGLAAVGLIGLAAVGFFALRGCSGDVNVTAPKVPEVIKDVAVKMPEVPKNILEK